MDRIKAGIFEEEISYAEVYQFIEGETFGAQAAFFGVVRDNNEGKRVVGMSYQAFEPLAQKVLREICLEANNNAGGELKIIALHRVGELEIGQASVAIGVGAPHRDQAFQACRYVTEEIKKRLPVWKHEHYEDGESAWLKGNTLVPEEAVGAKQ